FGKLIVFLPVDNVHGKVTLRHDDKKWKVDVLETQPSARPAAITYIGFLNDVRCNMRVGHGGSVVVLTYVLSFDDLNDFDPSPSPTSSPSEEAIKHTLKKVVADTSVLPNGGYIGFGLRHYVPVKRGADAKAYSNLLVGKDAELKHACEALGLEWRLTVLYDCDE
ncbi:hypothetical protein CONPUDRAFT_17575, partial [Coniophora puteana RWD-64-598 SS2]